jgi:hypothetical protein
VRHLDAQFLRGRPPAVRHTSLAALGSQCSVLLSALATEGHADDATAAAAFAAGLAALRSVMEKPPLAPRRAFHPQAVHEAITALLTATPQARIESSARAPPSSCTTARWASVKGGSCARSSTASAARCSRSSFRQQPAWPSTGPTLAIPDAYRKLPPGTRA